MKLLKQISTIFLFIFMVVFMLPAINVQAADTYTISYVLLNGDEISSATVTSGDTLNTLPTVDDHFIWMDSFGSIVSESTIPTGNMTVVAVKNSDVSDSGTMDNGNITWFIADKKLYVTGTGTIGNIPAYNKVGATKLYGLSLGDVEVANPTVKYEWQNTPSIINDKDGGYGSYTVPADSTHTLSLSISRPVRFTDQTISYPHSTVKDYAPWINSATDLTDITIADSVKLSGNFTLYFNLNSTAVSPGSIKESVYTNVKNIYLYGDTSAITQMSGMFAYMPALENVFVKSGEQFDASACVDTSAMFYGNEKLLAADSTTHSSIINTFSNMSNISDMRYMFFDCKSLVTPKIGAWDVSSVQDTSYMFTGCNSIKLTIFGSGEAHDLSGWNTSNVLSTVGMFAGSDINLSAEDPLANLWGETSSQVVVGDVDLDTWDLNSLQVSVFMFAQNSGMTGFKWTTSAPALVDSSSMFAFNTGLSSVVLSGLDTPSLAYSDVMFFHAGKANGICNFQGWDISALSEARLMFYGSKFSTMNFDNTNPSLLSLATGMFANSANLSSLGTQALSNWTLSNVTDASYMFFNDALITAIDATSWDMGSVENISYMLSNCTALQDIDVSAWHISDSLTYMTCFMSGCHKITSVNIYSWDASGVIDAFYAFADMPALTSFNSENMDYEMLANTNGMFANDTSLVSVKFGDSKAPKLVDAAGMFFSCSNLQDISIGRLVCNSTENISFMFKGCESLNTLNISGWDTSNVKYMHYMLDGMKSLEKLTIGLRFTTPNVLSVAGLCRNCSNLSNSSLQSLIQAWDSASTVSVAEMFMNCSNLEVADFSDNDFSNCSVFSEMFYGDEKLSVIILSDTFGQKVDEDSNANSVFFSPNQVLTYLSVITDGTTLPDFLKNYDWDADNRAFLLANGTYVGEKAGSSFTFNADSADETTLKFEATSTFYINNTPLPISYTWKNGDTTISDTTDNTYIVKRGTTGTFVSTASLEDIPSDQTVSGSFNISQGAGLAGITASYTGDPIVVGEEYSLSDLTVKLTSAKGKVTTLSSSDYTVNNQKVAKRGTNYFTAYYTDIDGVVWSSDFMVTGYRPIGEITAKYTGPSIEIGNDYSSSYIALMAYYADDTDKSEGFLIVPSSVSSSKVTSVGENKFTAYYIDKDNNNKKLSADFTVTGVDKKAISSIQASYKGQAITVGKNYSMDDVEVTLTYKDNSTEKANEFTVNSTYISQAGDNAFNAKVVDSDGQIFTATFSVPGIAAASSSDGKDISHITAIYNGDEVKVGSNYQKNDVIVTIFYENGLSSTTSDFTLDSTLITASGSNTFTATVTESDGETHTADFTVSGWILENVASIDAVYNGPIILIGNDYDKKNVVVTVKFTDGTPDMIIDDFTVSSTTVTAEGTNTFTAYVTDSNNVRWSDDFLVRGTSDPAEAANSAASLMGVQTGDTNDIIGLLICLMGLLTLLAALLCRRFGLKGEQHEQKE